MTTQEQLAASDVPKTKRELRDLVNEVGKRLGRYMTDDDVMAIRYQIANDEIVDEIQLVAAIHVVISRTETGLNPFDTNSNRDRKEAHALGEEILGDLDLPTGGHNWDGGELMSTKIISGPARFFADMFSGGTMSDLQHVQGRDDVKRQRENFGLHLLSNNIIDNAQLTQLREAGLLDPKASWADVVDLLSDWGVQDSVIEDAMQQSTSATLRRAVKEIERAEEADDFANQEDMLVSDDDRIKRRKQFELLDSEKPGKYMWNPDNAHIYDTDGSLIDGITGDIMGLDDDGQPPTGIDYDDFFWQEAAEQQAPWAEFNIQEEDYYSLLDVVENPQWYHQGGVGRFSSGGAFLGGFASDYGVVQTEKEQREQLTERFGQKWLDPVSGQPKQSSDQALIAAMRAGQYQEVRRPWYDPKDQWALYAGMSTESIRGRQQELIDMGALDGNEVVFGWWGEAEAAVTFTMMNIANGNALQLEDISDGDWKEYWQKKEEASAPKRPVYSAPSYRKMDPAAAQLTVEETIRRQLGRDASADELADLGMHLTDMHRQSFVADVEAQRGEFNAQVRATDSGTANQAAPVGDVDYQARFQQQFEKSHEAELARWDRTQDASQRQSLIGGALNGFMQQLGGGIGGGV